MAFKYVTKADGSKQDFDREKIVKTCIRVSGGEVDRKTAEEIASEIENRSYDGISTKKILEMLFNEYLKPYKTIIPYRNNLRKSISLLRSKPDFELYIQLLLEQVGYSITPNCICRGKCVEHEIDAIARKGADTKLVEVKHHRNHHTPTDLDVCRNTRAVLEDVIEGYQDGKNSHPITSAMIVGNTKFTRHAERYCKCRGIELLAWYDLESIIEEKKFYPITLLKGISRKVNHRLIEVNIITLQQLVESDSNQLAKTLDIEQEIVEDWILRSKKILSG
jgi:predicted RecB family nuclease